MTKEEIEDRLDFLYDMVDEMSLEINELLDQLRKLEEDNGT